MFCKNCGREIPENARFCGGCGTPVSRPEEIPVQPESPAEPIVPPAEPVPAAPQEPREPEEPRENIPPEGTPRRAQYDLCVNALVLDGWDRREITVSGADRSRLWTT